jgi:hypothetical protein
MLERYEIRAGCDAPCELWAITRFREDKVTEGTHTHCKRVMEKLKGVDVDV